MNKHTKITGTLRKPSVFRQLGSIMCADSCRDRQTAAERGEVELNAWARESHPGIPLGKHLPGICTTGYWDAKRPQNWGLERHWNEGFKFAYLSRGNLRLTVDDESYLLEQGQFIVIRPWQLHAIGDPTVGPSRLLWLILDAGLRRPSEDWHWPDWVTFSRDGRERLSELLSQNNQPIWNGSSELHAAFEAVPQILLSRTPETGETSMKTAINIIMPRLLKRMAQQAPALDPDLSTSRHTVAIFLRRLAMNTAQNWTLELMAEDCGLSRTRFADHCKHLTNMSPVHYLRHLRLEQAATLLRLPGRASVIEIASHCGFSSGQYFATAFRKGYGHAPTTTRQG